MQPLMLHHPRHRNSHRCSQYDAIPIMRSWENGKVPFTALEKSLETELALTLRQWVRDELHKMDFEYTAVQIGVR